MKLAYSHLARLLKDKPSKKEISDLLFQLGHEHELENNIFDLEINLNVRLIKFN